MNRRRFIAAVATATAAYPAEAAEPQSPVAVEVVHPRNPFESLLKDIEPGLDEFPLEREAARIAAHLNRLTTLRSLPLASNFQGVSPCPSGYRTVAPGVTSAVYDPSQEDFQTGLTRWLDSLGPLRAARFFVLPGDLIRYEIASALAYRVGVWKQQWADGQLTHFSPLEETVTTAPVQLFRDVTAHAFRDTPSFHTQLRCGIPAWRARLDSTSGMDVHGHNGIAVADIDGDGVDEIYVCQPGGLPNRLYRNRGDGALEDITEHSGLGVLDPTASALFVDFRNSGHQDLVLLRPSGPLLFLNQGGSRFALKPGAFRFRTVPQGNFAGMCAADYDRDGRVDLYLCSYSFFRDGGQYRYPTPYRDARNGPANFLFRNQLAADGAGEFADVTEATGMNHNNDRFSLAASWCDYNGDGWPDLYVANDFGRKNLYRNNRGKFRDVAAEAGVEDIGAGMSASWFDYDGDGRPDLYVSNMWSDVGQRIVSQRASPDKADWQRHTKGNSLYRNRGDGTFEETGALEGVEMGRWAWSSDGVDFDNDGAPEIFVSTGMITNASETDLEGFFWRKVASASPSDARPDAAYENGWNALSQAAHQQFSEAGRQPNVFYVRRGRHYYDFSGVSGLDVAEDSRAFAVTDLDGDGNPDLILKSRLGPQVRIYQNNSTQGRPAIAFRLRGVASNRDAIGARVEVDGRVKFLQAGSGYLSQHTKVLHFGMNTARVAQQVRILWPSGSEQTFHALAAGFTYTVSEGSAEWRRAAFSPPRELPSSVLTGENSSVFVNTWLMEPVPLPEKQPGPGFLHLPATLPPDRAAKYALFVRYLFDLRADLKLPVWFLVDDQSRAHKIYFSPPDSADLALLRDPRRMQLALPFAGRYYTEPRRDYSALGAAFYAAGYPDQALSYLERAPQENDKVLLAMGKIHLGGGRWLEARGALLKSLALAPESAEAWNALGAVDVGESNIPKALVNFEKALTLNPEMPSALVNAGQAHAALGNPERAEELYRRALRLNPKDAAAANQMGELCARLHRDTEARNWFQQAIASRRDYAPAIGNLGALYRKLGQANNAIAAFRYGTEVAPDEEAFYLNLASLYMASANRESARTVMLSLLARHPDSPRAKQALRELESR
jgi:tetratricopeptide (TPR) repeat protein